MLLRSLLPHRLPHRLLPHRLPLPAARSVAVSLVRASSTAPRAPLHQPLGVPPADTDLAASRTKYSSDAMDLVQAAAVTIVPGAVATCDGGGGALGHPLEYIQIDRPHAQFPAVCKYCGAKFIGEAH